MRQVRGFYRMALAVATKAAQTRQGMQHKMAKHGVRAQAFAVAYQRLEPLFQKRQVVDDTVPRSRHQAFNFFQTRVKKLHAAHHLIRACTDFLPNALCAL